ncbi:hypothetical protein NQ314_002179 [Rhamnusium bicolor]|uniref:Integrase SAM-like N-terminal domain-containing protein n=1 Tax=Rhamnusium bicolor TaxID=1586634 RepID=A0AAV8ZQL0_9CUCU|nr:hypothetical protein NQ314_002179 [Rhamnusium bicolor]
MLSYLRKDVPEASTDTILASISESTLKQYDSTYRLWWNFCSEHKISLYEGTTKDVLNFLQTVLEQHRYKYGTFTSMRSVLYLILFNNLGTDLGTDPSIKRYLRGISRLRPSNPRYENTWDPQPLMIHIEKLTEHLSLQKLSQKLVTLIALTTGEGFKLYLLFDFQMYWKMSTKFRSQSQMQLKQQA